ncbi:MAG: serine--tRNA ligase [Deltaproteobacteria bacterium]|jgi:seryl-tRNA synthetase|nr:serine--tRNA ligase [Deltaproteobacteria bacterium]
MLDLRFVRENIPAVAQMLKNRLMDPEIMVNFEAVDRQRRTVLAEIEELKALRNRANDQISERKKEKKDARDLIEEVRDVSAKIKDMEPGLSDIETRERDYLAAIPNMPDESVPIGGETANREIRRWGRIPEFDFEPKNHWELGESLGLMDFPRAAKLAGSRFVVLKGQGAALTRALINFMVELHTKKHGYTEIWPPALINSQSLYSTGQLPKFADESFKLENSDLWLVPTAEVPVTNLFRDETLPAGLLPVSYAAYTPCFRAEAGAAGKDTRGMIRMHQFDKVELVKFTRPEDSGEALEQLTGHAEEVLKQLDLSYRVVLLSSGDMGFSSAKTYDLEVWLPGPGLYREISSCSCFTDFQARRAGIRFKRSHTQKAEFVHTLNGSGLAVGRTMVAILENYQRPDGTVAVPEVLRPYLGGTENLTGL